MLLRIKIGLDPGKLRDLLTDGIKKLELILSDYEVSGPPGQLSNTSSDILIIDDKLLPEPKLETLKLILQTPEPPTIIVLTMNEREEQTAMLAIGCEAVLSLRTSPQMISRAIMSIIRKQISLENEKLSSKQELSEPRLTDFVSRSRAMQTFLNTVKKVVNSDSSLLILGETGVGKERLALAIHGESKRKESPFIPVNCAALPENLMESELFGHEKGAFTGALKSRRGAFELAHKGTIFLDEIGEMPLHLQVKLLRVIQERQFVRVGGETQVKVDVRVMAATNRDLALEVKNGTFRKDLFYRLSVIGLNIPPLSERREDIPELTRNYIEYLAPRIGVSVKRIDDTAMHALVNYSWPGNVRELINVVERAMLLCEGETITANEMPDDILIKTNSILPGIQLAEYVNDRNIMDMSWKDARNAIISELEKKYFSDLLEKHNGKVYNAAKAAGISPRAYYQKLEKYPR